MGPSGKAKEVVNQAVSRMMLNEIVGRPVRENRAWVGLCSKVLDQSHCAKCEFETPNIIVKKE